MICNLNLLWATLICCERFEFAVGDLNLLWAICNLLWVICNLLWAIWICCERFEFDVSDLNLMWAFGFDVTVVSHRISATLGHWYSQWLLSHWTFGELLADRILCISKLIYRRRAFCLRVRSIVWNKTIMTPFWFLECAIAVLFGWSSTVLRDIMEWNEKKLNSNIHC